MTEYIVTGATGFIGKKLVEKLSELNYKPIKVITRNKNNATNLLKYDVTILEGDVTNKDFLLTVINSSSVIFHLAGIIDITTGHKRLVYETNFLGTKNLVDVALMKNAKKIIYCSSSSVIFTKEKIINEPTNFNIKKLIGHYAKSKALASKYFLEKTKEGLNGVIVYPTAVYGSSEGSSEINEVINKYINKKLPIYIKGSYNFVSVIDVAIGMIKAYDKGDIGEGYILSGENMSLKTFFKTINSVINRKRLPIKIPIFIVILLIPILRLHAFILNKKPLFTLTSLKILNQNSNFISDKAINLLDYKTSDFKDNIKVTIEFLNNKEGVTDGKN